MITFKLTSNDIPWDETLEFDNLNVFQTPSWIEFLMKNEDAIPVVAEIRDGDQLLGYFKGLTTRKFGFKLLGCPLRGWGTYFMGFNLKPQVSRAEILTVFPEFVFDTLKCHYFEILDPLIRPEDVDGLPMEFDLRPRYMLDLSKSEEQILANMKSSCRNLIRQSIRKGVTIEEAQGVDFVDDYYAQLTDVFAKQSLEPPYPFERIKSLVEIMLPTDNILLLKAKDPTGKCIATGIFLGFNHSAVFWGAASWREYQSLRPNEALAWYGIKYWKAKGVKEFHFGGGMPQYKSKYGCEEVNMVRLRKAKYSILERFETMVSQNQKLRDLVVGRS